MKYFKFILFILIASTPILNLQAQKIVEFSQYKIVENEYGNKYLEIQPHSRVSPSDPKYNRNTGVYGVLICYEVNGKQKAARQDMTYKLANKGKYSFYLCGSSSRLGNVSVEYFNLKDLPKNQWPEKSKCF
ncbi:MAG: hypothetical protein GVY05_10280 [Bacteroidetes bacterium]|jgi:hypothetical protein|nr:hypothetical protein [Bacteroidota bacterium]